MRNTLLKTLPLLCMLAFWQPTHAQQWTEVCQFTNAPYQTVPYFHNADTGWIAVYQRLYYTTNGGESVQQVYQIPDSLIDEESGWTMIQKFYPVSSTVAYMYLQYVGDRGMYKTTDGGLTFTEWEQPLSSFYLDPRIYISEDTVVAYNTVFYKGLLSIVLSTDGGLTWTITTGDESINQGINAFSKTHNGTIWAFGRANNNYFYSTDNGLSWQAKPALIDNNYFVVQVSFLDEENAVMLTSGKNDQHNYEHYLYVTDDGFNTIKYVHGLFDYLDCRDPVELWYQKEDAIWLVHTKNMYKSVNKGASFEIYQSLGYRYVDGLHFKGNTGYFGTYSVPCIGGVMKFIDTTTSITPLSIIKNTMAVFPNPAKNEINIQLPHTAGEKLLVSIASFEGKTLYSSEIIVDATKPTIVLPVQFLSNGVYLIRVKGIEFSETSKFIINR